MKINENQTKTDVIESLNNEIGISKSFFNKFIDAYFKIIFKKIKLEKKVIIKNFGTFRLLYKKKRIGRNPKNLKPYEINDRYVVSFKASSSLKNRINKNN